MLNELVRIQTLKVKNEFFYKPHTNVFLLFTWLTILSVTILSFSFVSLTSWFSSRSVDTISWTRPSSCVTTFIAIAPTAPFTPFRDWIKTFMIYHKHFVRRNMSLRNQNLKNLCSLLHYSFVCLFHFQHIFCYLTHFYMNALVAAHHLHKSCHTRTIRPIHPTLN